MGFADDVAPAIDHEIATLTSTAPSAQAFTGHAATADRLRREAPYAELLHLACHAAFADDSPHDSGLKLADGWIPIRELIEMPLRNPLVVLSSCESARSEVAGGEELIGLLQTFVRAGAATIVASLWKLNDQVAHQMMARMYQLIMNQGDHDATVLQALGNAMRERIAAGSHPAFWAPFVVVGEPK